MGSALDEAAEMACFKCQTKVLPMMAINPPFVDIEEDLCEWFFETFPFDGPDYHLVNDFIHAANSLKSGLAPPVAFPTETVYGLGADATRSESVRSIYAAKNRPSDNPLIVHVASLPHLRSLLNGPIPTIYEPLIRKFWPGPLTILLPLPDPSPLAPEVTCGLKTFGARLPSTPLARLLISIVGKPIAAPSANASTRPSPTTAQHVAHDLNGRIHYILDGGSCQIGVESTVIDGLSDPPAILRPGGIGIEEIKKLGGKWAHVTIGYQDRQQLTTTTFNGAIQAPRAPGMKYKHYAPKGRVFLSESGASERVVREKLVKTCQGSASFNKNSHIGIVTTLTWADYLGLPEVSLSTTHCPDLLDHQPPVSHRQEIERWGRGVCDLYNIRLGRNSQEVARNLFAALRTLDQLQCSMIFVEGIPDTEGDLAAAVMNRLRKAAEVEVNGEEGAKRV